MLIKSMLAAQVLTCVDKDASGRVTQRELMGVQYVPLVHTGKQPPQQASQAAQSGSSQAREE
jgi:hypothetical protein